MQRHRMSSTRTKDMSDITNQQLLDGVNETIQGLIDIIATKDDLKPFATKDDLRASEERIKAKIVSSRSISNKHHIETRNMIGSIESALGGISDSRKTHYEM